VDNSQAARTIFLIAALLEEQGANPYRIRAYRRAAINMLRLPVDAGRFAADGELLLPWLGERLRRKLGELVTQGQMRFFEELLAELPAEIRALLSVSGVGPKTALRLVDELQIRSVEDLARAARQHRLQRLRGFGPRREANLGAAAERLLAAAA
jgi:DNA polymerase (family 10)